MHFTRALVLPERKLHVRIYRDEALLAHLLEEIIDQDRIVLVNFAINRTFDPSRVSSTAFAIHILDRHLSNVEGEWLARALLVDAGPYRRLARQCRMSTLGPIALAFIDLRGCLAKTVFNRDSSSELAPFVRVFLRCGVGCHDRP
jgi:hypothetical protein